MAKGHKLSTVRAKVFGAKHACSTRSVVLDVVSRVAYCFRARGRRASRLQGTLQRSTGIQGCGMA